MVAYFSAVTLLVGTLHGHVVRGPITPVCRVGVPCTAPAARATLYFTRAGRTVTAVTNAKGNYRIRLEQGLYAVKTKRQSLGAGVEPRTARVLAGRDRRADFHIDTGIR